MKLVRLHPFSLCVGCVFAAVVFFAMSQKPAAGKAGFDYKVQVDLDDSDIAKLAADGWEYVGYLGTSSKGASMDETLWKRPTK